MARFLIFFTICFYIELMKSAVHALELELVAQGKVLVLVFRPQLVARQLQVWDTPKESNNNNLCLFLHSDLSLLFLSPLATD